MLTREPLSIVLLSFQAISELPRPNRDTLAYLIIHLQAVAYNSAINKMDADNLSVVCRTYYVLFCRLFSQWQTNSHLHKT